MQKYIHNIFNACKISFFNEMRTICEAVKVDTDKIFDLVVKSAEASWNPQYGIRNLGPYGGSCLPKDTTAFLAWAKDEKGKSLPLLEAVIKTNEIAEIKMICEAVKIDADRIFDLVVKNSEVSWNPTLTKDELGKFSSLLKTAIKANETAKENG